MAKRFVKWEELRNETARDIRKYIYDNLPQDHADQIESRVGRLIFYAGQAGRVANAEEIMRILRNHSSGSPAKGYERNE